jgi:hypothetical protein
MYRGDCLTPRQAIEQNSLSVYRGTEEDSGSSKTKQNKTKNKQTPWSSVRKRTIPTERPTLDEM